MAKARLGRKYPSTFAADIEGIAELTDRRLLAVARASFSDVIDIAQTPTAKGGRMRVDTGYLRASGQFSLNGMPTGGVRGADNAVKYQYDDGNKPLNVTLLDTAKIGAVFHFGWTANYARYREVFDGFLEGALQHWGTIVTYHVDQARERIK